MLDRREVRQSRGGHQTAKILRHVERLTRSVLAGAADDAVCVGIGAGVCGVVRHTDGLVRFAPNLGWVDVPFGQQLAERLATSLPVTVGNDADLGALSEHVRGAARDARNVIFLSGEVGVGGGIILDGRPMSGRRRLRRRGRPHGGQPARPAVPLRGARLLGDRGRRGRRARGGRPARTARSRTCWPRPPTATARRAPGCKRVGHWLGVGIANLVNVFNPEVVVFGGVLRQLLPATEAMVRTELAYALAAPREQVRLALPQLGGDATLLGAAESAFAPLLDDPLGVLARGSADTTQGRTRA